MFQTVLPVAWAHGLSLGVSTPYVCASVVERRSTWRVQTTSTRAMRHPRGRSQKQERTGEGRAAPTRHRRRACSAEASTEVSAGGCRIPPSTASKYSSFNHNLPCRILIFPDLLMLRWLFPGVCACWGCILFKKCKVTSPDPGPQCLSAPRAAEPGHEDPWRRKKKCRK